MTFEEEKIESAKIGMILDAVFGERAFLLIYQRESGTSGIVAHRTTKTDAVMNLRMAADSLERGDNIEFDGTRTYPHFESDET